MHVNVRSRRQFGLRTHRGRWPGSRAEGIVLVLARISSSNTSGPLTKHLADIPHIKLPGSRQRTMLDESHSSFSHEYRQPPNQAHKTIWPRRELVFSGQWR